MNVKEAKTFLHDHGIYQLNSGETLADALDHVQNGTPRKGYKVRADNGRILSKNEVLMHENKAAFNRSFTPKEFHSDEVEDIDDISDSNDYRESKGERGVIIQCFYCGDCLRVDACSVDDDEDYGPPQDTLHCDGCMNSAISRLAM